MTTKTGHNIQKGDLVCFAVSFTTAYNHRTSNIRYGREDLFKYRYIGNNIILTMGLVLEIYPPETKSLATFAGQAYHSVLINNGIYYVKENDLKVVEDGVES